MVWSLKFPDISSSGNPLVLKVSYSSITSLAVLTGVQCERQRHFPVRILKQNSLPGGCIWVLGRLIRLFYLYRLCSRVHPCDIPGHIFLFVGGNLLAFHDSSKDELPEAFCVGQSCARFIRRKSFN